jgi:hypothetical protein
MKKGYHMVGWHENKKKKFHGEGGTKMKKDISWWRCHKKREK